MKKNITKILSVLLITLFSLFSANAQTTTTVFSDNFEGTTSGLPTSTSGATFTTGSTPSLNYTTLLTVATSSASIQTVSTTKVLQLLNGTSSPTKTTDLVSVPLSSFSSPYNTTLHSSPGLVTWYFNMQSNNNSTGVFGTAGNYCPGVILVSTNSTTSSLMTSGNGYAVVSTTAKRFDLVKFTGGLNNIASTVITGTVGSGSSTTWRSIKVTYDPSNDNWSLYVREDGSTLPADPSAGTGLVQQGSATAESTYTSSAMSTLALAWGHNNSTNKTAQFDNLKVTVFSNTCTAPTYSTNLTSTTTRSTCQNGTAFSGLTVAASGSPTYQWYSNTTATNSGGSSISGATSATYTPSNTTTGTLFYYCIANTGTGCNTNSNISDTFTVKALPTPTFTSSPGSSTSLNTSVTYTTQSGQSSYIWSVPGTLGTDYSITSGGTSSTDNTVTLTWLTPGSKVVTVNYSNNGCAGTSAASNTTNVSAAAFYNKASSDITNVANWSTNSNGIGGTQPSNFTDAGQTFNLFNTGATMSTTWDVQGSGSKVIIGDGTNAVTFAATNAFTATNVDVSNLGVLQLQTATIPTFGTLATGSTVDYGGSSITQVVTTTTYSNLTLSGSGTRTFSGTTSITGTFNPGSGFSGTSGSTINFNGTSTSQAIPAFAYSSLTVAGVDGKSTSGSLTVSGTLTMSNSFTVPVGSTLALDSNSTISSTTSKVLTVNGTFQNQYKITATSFSAGSGSITVSAGGTFKILYYAGNSALTFTNVNFTSGIGAAGSTFYITGSGAPRLPSASTTFNGNVVYETTQTGLTILLNATPYTITGNLTINSTGTGSISHGNGGSGRALTVQGNLIMTGGKYSVAASPTSVSSSLTVNGNVTLSGSTDTLYASTATSGDGGSGSINIKGNLSHTSSIFGTPAGITSGTIVFNGSASQDISTTGLANGVNVTLNNSTGARLLTDLSVAGTLTLTSGKLRTNGFSVIMTGTTSTISGPSFGAASTSYIATCDASGTPSTTGGLTIQNIGSTGRSTAVTFPIGPNTSSYNPFTITNSSANVSFTARVNTTAIAGIASDSAVQRTWNIQPSSGSPSSTLAMQWNAADSGLHFTRTSASVAHYNAGASAIDIYSTGGASAGSNPYTLSPVATSFTGYGDFGVINGIIIPANEPTVQATLASVVAGTTTMTVNWTKSSDATNSVVVIKQASAVNGAPTDGISYADGGSVFASGTQIGSGNYVVYTGTGNSVTVTGLTSGVTYHIAVYAYNGSNGTENYLTSSPATANGTTGTPTYYYVGGAGNSTNTFATANMWATTLNGTPLSGFTPGNSDVFIFDASNLGGGYTDSVTIGPISSATVLGKILLLNNAKINILAGGTRTMTIGNSGYPSNTTVISVPAGSKLYISGSQNTISLAANSSANISGSFYLGNGGGNSTLVPNATGSFITVNSGGYVESNLSSSSTNPFGTSGTNLVTFASGSVYKHTKASDVFGGAGNSVVSFAQGSLFWYANTSNSSSQTLSGRTFGNVRVEGGWSPAAGSAGFTMYDFDMPSTTSYTLSIIETGTNNHIKGNINVAAAGTFKLNPGSAATLNFSGTSLQTITMAGTWNLGTTVNQSFVLSNTAGLSLAGNINLSNLAGTSMTVNSGCNLNLASGTLNVVAGTLNLAGTLTRTAGLINGSTTGATINNTGVASFPSGLFTSNNVRTLIVNRSAGLSISGSLTISTALTLTSGIVNMGTDTMIIASTASVSRTSGWVNGKLRKNFAKTINAARTFEIGDATNYLPVALTFDSVSTAGDLIVRTVGSAASQANYLTAPISNTNYINRYWSISKPSTFAFVNNYSATFNYVAGDKVGTATESSVIAARYNAGWTTSTPTAGTNANTVSNLTGLGDFILADVCVTVTPSVTISTATDTVCSGNSVIFTANGVNPGPSPIYTWYKNASSVGTGTTITFPGGTLSNGDVISCVLTANNACQTSATANSNSHIMTVKSSPSIGVSTGFTACSLGSTIGIYNTNTQGGGVWSSSNTAVATVTTASNGGTGLVVPVGNGTSVLTYSKTNTSNGCVSIASANVIVAVATTPNAITGTNSICKGSTTQLSNTTTGGVWSISPSSYASINSTGLVTSTSTGVATAKYTTTNANGCTASSTYTITVNAIPALPTIGYQTGTNNPQIGAGSGNFCANRTFTVVGSPSGGVWSKTGVITVTTPGGLVATGSIAGAGSLTYTYTNSNGCSSSRTIAGNVVVCASRGVNGGVASNEQLVTSSEFTMYPNPAKSFISLNVKTLIGTGSIVVTDLYGKQVKVQALSIGNNTVDISAFAKGIYLVSMITNEGKSTKKLIVE